jgi:hypothetical protein
LDKELEAHMSLYISPDPLEKKLLFAIDKMEYNVDKNMISIDWNGFF